VPLLALRSSSCMLLLDVGGPMAHRRLLAPHDVLVLLVVRGHSRA